MFVQAAAAVMREALFRVPRACTVRVYMRAVELEKHGHTPGSEVCGPSDECITEEVRHGGCVERFDAVDRRSVPSDKGSEHRHVPIPSDASHVEVTPSMSRRRFGSSRWWCRRRWMTEVSAVHAVECLGQGRLASTALLYRHGVSGWNMDEPGPHEGALDWAGRRACLRLSRGLRCPVLIRRCSR